MCPHPMERCRVNYKGEGGGFPQVRAVVNLVSLSCLWLVLTPKVFQLCTNHLVLILCRFMWVVEAYQFFLVPFRSSSTPLYPSKVLRAKECAPTPYSFVVFNLDLHLSPSRSWERIKYNRWIKKYLFFLIWNFFFCETTMKHTMYNIILSFWFFYYRIWTIQQLEKIGFSFYTMFRENIWFVVFFSFLLCKTIS
jgi:hypothetical protein